MARAAVGNGDVVVGIEEGGIAWFLSSALIRATSCGRVEVRRDASSSCGGV